MRFAVIMVLCCVLAAIPTSAANIHLHYFESIDAFLTRERFQRYSFSALEDEEVTIVAYGLENDTIPELTVFDTLGSTLIENPNEEGLSAVAVQFTTPENGIYTFLVSRQTDAGGLVRVMVFEGDPLVDDRSLVDTVDPLLPARAFLFAGDEVDPVEIRISVVDDDDPETPAPEVFASRGTDIELPPLEERTTPVTTQEWENTQSERVYTVNIRALPEPVARVNGYFSRTRQETGSGILQIDVEEGGEPEQVIRPVCVAFVLESLQAYSGPNADNYAPSILLQRGQEIEIIGEHNGFFLIVDTESETGGSWIPSVSVDIPAGLESEDCSRVVEVDAPPLEETEPEEDEESPPNTGFNPPANNTQPEETQVAGDPEDNWCYDPAKWGDGRCNTGSAEQDTWHWTCGYYMAQFDQNQSRDSVPIDCVSALPPLPEETEPVGGGSFPGSWSGCNVVGPTGIVAATYSGTPAGTVTVQLDTSYGSATGSPPSGTIFHDTGVPSYPPFLVSGTLLALDGAYNVIGSVNLGTLAC